MKSSTYIKIYIPAALLLMFGLLCCRSLPQRESAIVQIQAAEQTLQQANAAEAQVYVLEKYLEALMMLRRARNSMRSEDYGQSHDLAQRSREIALQAIQQTKDERMRVKEQTVRLLYSADEVWESYAIGYEKELVSIELIEIRKLIDTSQEHIEARKYMAGLKKVQIAHEKLADLPEAVERRRITRLEEEKQRIKSLQTAEEIITAAKSEAEHIIAEARKEAEHSISEAHTEAEHIIAEGRHRSEQILAETGEIAARARRVEFERMFPTTYQVRSGETLIDIARRHEVFNDQFMWPLLYKANRDQIRDPQMVFPGQVLAIPRDIIHEDIIEARKMAEAAPPYAPPSTAYNPDIYQRYMQILPRSPDGTGIAAEPSP